MEESSKNIVCCPKCGGTNGYVERTLNTHVQLTDFQLKAIDCEIYHVKGGKTKHCADCRKDITAFVDSLKKQYQNETLFL